MWLLSINLSVKGFIVMILCFEDQTATNHCFVLLLSTMKDSKKTWLWQDKASLKNRRWRTCFDRQSTLPSRVHLKWYAYNVHPVSICCLWYRYTRISTVALGFQLLILQWGANTEYCYFVNSWTVTLNSSALEALFHLFHHSLLQYWWQTCMASSLVN
jgi:hypothetical protein